MKYNLSNAIYKKTLDKFPLTAQDKEFIHKNMINSRDILPAVNSDLNAIYANGKILLDNGKLTIKAGQKIDKQIKTNHIMHNFLAKTNAYHISLPIYKTDLSKDYFQTNGLSNDTRGTFGKNLVKALDRIRKHKSKQLANEYGFEDKYSYKNIISHLKPNQIEGVLEKVAYSPNAIKPKDRPKHLEDTIISRASIHEPHVTNFAQAGKFLQDLGVKIKKIKEHPTRREAEKLGFRSASINKHHINKHHGLHNPQPHIKRGQSIN